MKERPIIFSGPMVRAILDGTKTQTRRVMRSQPPIDWQIWGSESEPSEGWFVWDFCGTGKRWGDCEYNKVTQCPHGQPGDRLWVRETYSLTQHGKPVYRADGKDINGFKWGIEPGDPSRECLWKSPLFMPRCASRITLELVKVRVERLQDISEEDAKAEGVRRVEGTCEDDFAQTPAGAYQVLWDSIHGPGSWAANPWAWVLEFKRINP